ncbi:hypothetical protein BIW11_10463 [Tropilaelaps mercedesae]|uniref:PDZ domain-containing protein n=1 Tax=Tropilaelaps mercedesae TaxID=418985 RepID=A0A1V9XFJ0_9ACAR|nr:hypothetical protein BIW11_10463 [Tropilaelaps mercedesae]
MEEEEARQIRKVKTFSEMMQQRQSRQQSASHLNYNLNFFGQEQIPSQDDDDVHFDEGNKENGLVGHKRLTTADSVDSQSEGKSSDGTCEERLGSEGSQGSEERLASPVDPWTADSGVDSLSGSGCGAGGANYAEKEQSKSNTSAPTSTEVVKDAVIQPRPASVLSGPNPPKYEIPSNPNEVIIRLSINPSSDIFGFTLTQHGQKVIVESVDEDGVADLAGLKQGDEVISLNGVLADSPGSVPSSMDLALMTGQLEMVIYRADAQAEESIEVVERRTNFKMKLAKFCSGELGQGHVDGNGDKVLANEVIIEPKLVERRKSQLFIQALQLEQDEEKDVEPNGREQSKQIPFDLQVEEQLVHKRKNSLSKSFAETTIEKKSPVGEIEPLTIERKKAEFIRQASSDNMVKKIDVKSEIFVEQHLVLQRKASIENAVQRTDEVRVVDSPSLAVAQLKASIENSGGSFGGEFLLNKSKTPSVDIETTLEERKASFFEHSGTRVERTTVDLNIEPKLIEQRKANFLVNAEAAQKTESRNLDLDIQPKLIEQRKANFLESVTKRDKPVQEIDIEPKTVEKKLMALQIGSEMAPAQFSCDQRKVELTVNSMQCKPKIEVAIEPDLIRKRKEALFCSSSMANDIERRRAKLANIEAEVYGTSLQDEQSTSSSPITTISLPISDKKCLEEERLPQSMDSDVYCMRSPTDHSDKSISEDSRSVSSTTTVTEIRREVGNTMLSSVASSSLFSPVSERNESPAHFSDLSPDCEIDPASKSNKTADAGMGSSSDVKGIHLNNMVGIESSSQTPDSLSTRKEQHSNVVPESSLNARADSHPVADFVSPPNPDPLRRIKDAGHTPWNKEKETSRLIYHSSSTSVEETDPKVVHIKRHVNPSGRYSQQTVDCRKTSGILGTTTQITDPVQRQDADSDRPTHQTSMQQLSPRQHLHVEAEVRVNTSPGQEPYGNSEVMASGSGEQLYQVPANSKFNLDLYDQLPSQPPKGIKKGRAPSPPKNIIPYNPSEELYENAPQLNRQQHMYQSLYHQQVALARVDGEGQMVQLATAVTTNQASLQGSHARFGPDPVDQEQIYLDTRRPPVHEAPIYGEMMRRRENPSLRHERKSYHEGAVNYPGYDYMQHSVHQQNQPTSGSGYPCSEDIYENTRKYTKSCEDIYENSNQLARATASNSHLLSGKSGELPLTGTAGSGYGEEIYENVEAYAKTKDYLNNLRKPSVAEDFYEAPRVAHEQGRILSASVNKPTLADAIQR